MKERGFNRQEKPQYKEVMNWKRFFFAFIAAFVVLFVFGFLWYATLMHNAHREVPTLLRPEADLKSYFGWLALGHSSWRSFSPCSVLATFQTDAQAPEQRWAFWWD